MKKIKWVYILPVILSVLLGIILIGVFFSVETYFKAAIAVFSPLIILVIGFRIITNHRIKLFRNQLYQILQTLEEFDIDEPRKVAFETSSFPLFNELNENLIELIDRVRGNYLSNKQFTQNASHELQTPLAIIRGHVEILLQSPNIKEKEMESLATVLQNTNRLAKLNSALILLSKIEHQRFGDMKIVDFKKVMKEVLGNFYDLIHIQELRIEESGEETLQVEMSETLAEILVANLVQNAIRHNVEDGLIKIEFTSNSFSITNTGKPLDGSVDALFKRFHRESNAEESLGLGLSIVKRICDQSGLDINYKNENDLHKISIHLMEEGSV